MGIRQFKPVTKSSRFRSVSDFDVITRTTPEKSLLEPLKKSGGRDNHGHISMRRIGGGHKRQYRIIDFKRNKFGVVGTVKEIEYDPNRSARIALVEYADGEKRYVLHCKGLAQGDSIVSGPGSDVRTGNAMPLKEVPLGTAVHNVELIPGKGGQMARSAGTSVQVVAKEGEYVTLRMASTEMRMVHGNCMATIGEVGNAEHELLSRRQGRRVALGRQASEGARRSDEPGGPPARRPHTRRSQRGEPVGQEGRRQDAQQEEGLAAVAGARPEARQSHAVRFFKATSRIRDYGEKHTKRALRSGQPAEARAGAELEEREEGREDLVAREHRAPRFRGAHVRGAQREQVHPGVRDRKHGRAQARRVRADAPLPRSHGGGVEGCRRGEGGRGPEGAPRRTAGAGAPAAAPAALHPRRRPAREASKPCPKPARSSAPRASRPTRCGW